MALSQIAIGVCNDGNVSQLDVTDQVNGGVYYRIEVFRSSQPSGEYGLTLSGSRVEDICGIDHLTPLSNQAFRYIFSVGDKGIHSDNFPILLEGREVFNPSGMPDGSWEIRIRDLDASSPTYGSILRATAAPKTGAGKYTIQYELRLAENVNLVPIHSPLQEKITQLNPTLPDLGEDLQDLPNPVGVSNSRLRANTNLLGAFSFDTSMKTSKVSKAIEPAISLISHKRFTKFRENLDSYEAFGDFGAKAVHPGTNLIGPNAKLAAESIFVRQYRAALVILGRLVSPDMARGAAQPQSLAYTPTNTRPGVYAKFVGAAINNIGIYKLGLDKVHSDYGGVPMKLAPGSRLENDATPVADAWRCNQTLGEIAKALYLAD